MIITRCPLRISLVGGSSDLQSFLDKHDWGSVVSFPSNLYTYITLKKHADSYKIVYSSTELVSHPSDIKNDIAREVLSHFSVGPVEITFNTDISSGGSGLASSSSYMIALIYAVNEYLHLQLSRFDICKLAVELERKFNPLTGYQDSYGCGIGGFKQMIFDKHGNVDFRFLSSDVLRKHAFYLIPTNKYRSSTSVLSTINIDHVLKLRGLSEHMVNHLDSDSAFNQTIRYSWELKKQTSPNILPAELQILEKELSENADVSSIKLLGAGGGGYFLLICPVPKPYIEQLGVRIFPDDEGVKICYG
jgi:D-glycero-alpha-D-manno-heptose-7-phosphate kinase